ncbi:MAG TPA: PIN domain-containing protein [Kofleriaceae bacterium]|jgi:predicted nucleic acid-binding protein|nr:PIN domain-containing protein [Kofleriaceae bacterium]
MGLLIDSTVFIAAERGKLDLRARLESRSTDWVGIAAITASELLHGVHRADSDERRRTRETFVESILASMPVVAFDLVVARVHSRLHAELLAKGAPVGLHDLQIAATAIAFDHVVVTGDTKSFPRITGLTFEAW